jgi:glutathione S-transferase
LKEKALEHELVIDFPWNRKSVFSKHHVFSDIPTLVDQDSVVLEGWYAIIEHLEQSVRASSLLGATPKEKAESRRIVTLFNEMFFADITKNIIFEKVIKKHMESSPPDSSRIRAGSSEIKKYFDYITCLVDSRNWLSGNEFSVADIAAAAQISCIDYIGSIGWDNYPSVKDWYVRIKSRPSFRDLLYDRIPNVAPPDYYSELDF